VRLWGCLDGKRIFARTSAAAVVLSSSDWSVSTGFCLNSLTSVSYWALAFLSFCFIVLRPFWFKADIFFLSLLPHDSSIASSSCTKLQSTRKEEGSSKSEPSFPHLLFFFFPYLLTKALGVTIFSIVPLVFCTTLSKTSNSIKQELHRHGKLGQQGKGGSNMKKERKSNRPEWQPSH